MAAGTFIVANKAKLNLLNAANLAGQTGTGYKIALLDSSFTPVGTEEIFADLSANELAAGDGYTAGGEAATSGGPTGATGTVTFDMAWASPTWTASGSGIPAWKYAVVYYVGTLDSKVNPILGWFEGNSGSTVALTTAGNSITITAGSGLFTLS